MKTQNKIIQIDAAFGYVLVRVLENINLTNVFFFKESLQTFISGDSEIKTLIFDLSRCKFLDSSGFNVLSRISLEFKSLRGKIILTGISQETSSTLRLINLDREFKIFDSIDQIYQSP